MKILSADHSKYPGRYFNFKRSSIPGLKNGGTLELKASNPCSGVVGMIKVFGSKSGSVGDAHGRWSDWKTTTPGDWKTGQIIDVYIDNGDGKRPHFTRTFLYRSPCIL